VGERCKITGGSRNIGKRVCMCERVRGNSWEDELAGYGINDAKNIEGECPYEK